jgi:hypothetical protein
MPLHTLLAILLLMHDAAYGWSAIIGMAAGYVYYAISYMAIACRDNIKTLAALLLLAADYWLPLAATLLLLRHFRHAMRDNMYIATLLHNIH